MVDYAKLWQQIDTLLRKEAPRAFQQFRGPITAGGHAWLQAQAKRGGGPLHPAIEATYAVHDGAQGSQSSLLGILPTSAELDWARACAWHSTSRSREEFLTWQDALGSDELGERWFPDWLPMGSDGGGNCIILGLTSGDLSAFDHEVAEPQTIVQLGEFLEKLEADLKAGLVSDDENGEGELVVGDLRAVVAARAHDEAETFIALLSERGLALLSPTAALREAVRPLLTIKSARQRAEKITKLLYDHGDVEEVFVDDEVLAVAIEEFT